MERDINESETNRAALAYTDAKLHRLTSDIDGLREQFKGDKADQRSSVNRADAAVGRDRDEAKRLQNSLEKEK